MARARNLKPGFFKNEELAECSLAARLCFAGLWTLADREGRLEDRPKRIKGELFAFDSIEVEPLLAELEARGFILRYRAGTQGLIQVLTFWKHQNPHHKEPKSALPSPDSLGLWVDGMGAKPEAFGSCDEPETQGKPEALVPLDDDEASDKPEALVPKVVIPSTQNPAESLLHESKPLIPESGALNPEKGAPAVSPKPPARAFQEAEAEDDPPPEANGHAPTRQGLLCRAMREAGFVTANPGDPRFLALVEQGVTEAECVGLATECVAKGKGWGWFLDVLPKRRAEAAAITLSPGGPPQQRGPAAPNVTVPSDEAERTQQLLREQSARRQDKPSPEVLKRIAAIKRVGA